MGKNKAVVIELDGDIDLTPESAYEVAQADGYLGSEEQYAKELAVEQVSQDKFDALPGRICKMVGSTEASDFHHIMDSAADKVLNFGMEGKTEQETVPGNQLFDISSFETAYTNINNGDGTITVTSYAPSVYNSITKVCPNIKVGQTIIFSGKNAVRLYFGGTANSANSAFEVTQEMLDNDMFAFYGNTDSSEDNPLVLSNIMLNPGNTALPCEEYVGGTPSPNPDFSQEIVNAGVYNEETGRYEHKCCVGNKNFANELIRGLLTDESGTISTVSTYYTNNFSNIKRVLPKGTYTIHIHGMKICISRYIVNGKYVNLSSAPMDKFTFTVSDVSETTICFSKGDGSVFDGSELVQLEYEGSVTDYIEGKSQPLTLTSPVPLTKWDKLVKRDGLYGWSIWYGVESYNADNLPSTVSVQTNKNGDTYFVIEELYPKATVASMVAGTSMSDSFIENNPYGTSSYCMWRRNNELRLFIEDTTVMDKVTLNAWITEHPFKVIYRTSEEQSFHPLPDEEQTLLNNLETYYGVTNVYNDQGCPMWLTYVQDTKIAVDNKFENIKMALISLGANV